MKNAKCKMQKHSSNALVFCIFNFSFCILSGCSTQQQTALEKQAEQAVETVKTVTEKNAAQAIRDTSASAAKTWANTTKNAGQGGVGLRVKSALALSSRLDGASVDVDVQGSRLILTGEVLTSTQKNVAENLVENIADPKFRIVNRLKIAGQQPDRNLKKSAARGY